MSFRVKGVNQFRKKLTQLERDARKAQRRAVRAGLAVLRKEIRDEVPVDEGHLKKFQDYKVLTKGDRISGIVGADVAKMEGDERRPTNIDWLVEYGHVAPNGVFVPGAGYMRRGAATGMPKAQAQIEKKLKEVFK